MTFNEAKLEHPMSFFGEDITLSRRLSVSVGSLMLKHLVSLIREICNVQHAKVKMLLVFSVGV